MSFKNTEGSYFFQKDRELIESRKSEEEKAIAENLLPLKTGHCSNCGEEMKAKQLDGIDYDFCPTCASVSLSLDSLNQLYKEHKFPRFKFTIDKHKKRYDLLHSFEENEKVD